MRILGLPIRLLIQIGVWIATPIVDYIWKKVEEKDPDKKPKDSGQE